MPGDAERVLFDRMCKQFRSKRTDKSLLGYIRPFVYLWLSNGPVRLTLTHGTSRFREGIPNRRQHDCDGEGSIVLKRNFGDRCLGIPGLLGMRQWYVGRSIHRANLAQFWVSYYDICTGKYRTSLLFNY